MRVMPGVAEVLESGVFVGPNRAHARVTVEPDWQLSLIGSGEDRGPYRYYQTVANDQEVMEVPNIKSIQIDRSSEEDAARCVITMYNTRLDVQEAEGQLGAPGYYWFDHGNPDAGDEVEEWGQVQNDWSNILGVRSLLRTYEGWGGFDDEGEPLPISEAVAGGYIGLTGVWLVDQVTAGTDGMLTLTCRDMAALLIDQQLFPPLVPEDCYPVEYWPLNSSPFDNVFDPPSPDAQPSLVLSNMDNDAPVACISMAAHPTGSGYWVLDQNNNVYPQPDEDPWGDAYNYGGGDDVGPVTSQCVSIAAHPSGNGYWTLEANGTVRAYGAAPYFGTWGDGANPNFIEIVPTFNGEGYWVVRRDGRVRAFGNASSFGLLGETQWVPKTALLNAMEAFGLFAPDHFTATAAAGHPTQMGLLIVNGNGEVAGFGAYGPVAAATGGGLKNRNGLKYQEWTHAVDVTADGQGYWLAFGSGQVAAFGSAEDLGDALLSDFELELETQGSAGHFYTRLVWDIAKASDSRGFYVLRANGQVVGIETGFWRKGGPEYPGALVYSDYVDVVRELLRWSGFTFAGDPDYKVYGVLESTGITMGDGSKLGQEHFDKMPIIDVIKMITDIVGYCRFVGQEGEFHWHSPNRWELGNWLPDGTRTTDLIEISELKTLTGYSVTVDSAALRSEVIVGTHEPDPDNPADTIVERYTPPSASKLRGMVVPAMWVEDVFKNPEEVKLLTRMIGASIWFAQRSGQVTAVGDPRVMIDDQIKIRERITTETYCHYVSSMSTVMDLDEGTYIMNLTTHWLGNDDHWAFTRETPGPEQFQLPPEIIAFLDDPSRTREVRYLEPPEPEPPGEGD